ncbi:hypothetical protein MXE00_15995, partial [Legionella pneumophila]|nr:hypothetical protein [Legionella pneumophila]
RLTPTSGSGIPWRNGESGDKTTNAKANGLFAGLSNTHLIISEQTIDQLHWQKQGSTMQSLIQTNWRE